MDPISLYRNNNFKEVIEFHFGPITTSTFRDAIWNIKSNAVGSNGIKLKMFTLCLDVTDVYSETRNLGCYFDEHMKFIKNINNIQQ